jgi:predicted DNA-binding ribbon-helix-helix protein
VRTGGVSGVCSVPEQAVHESRMKSSVGKRSITIAGRKTSVTLKDAFWNALKNIAAARQAPVSDLIASINSGTPVSRSIVGGATLCASSHLEKCGHPLKEMPSTATQSISAEA